MRAITVLLLGVLCALVSARSLVRVARPLAKANNYSSFLSTSARSKVKFEQMSLNIQINFQPTSSPTPDDYKIDSGDLYGDRGNGLYYGWNCDNTANVYSQDGSEEGTILVPNGKCASTNDWEIALPNDAYRVEILYTGDTSSRTTSATKGCTIEDQSASVGSLQSKWSDTYVAFVRLEDGKLTFSGKTGTCQTIASIKIDSVVDLKVNFQKEGTDTPSLYEADEGYIFGDRENGYSYGWSCDQTASGVNRGKGSVDDTLIIMDENSECDPDVGVYWEAGVPNGEYEVVVRYGDADNDVKTSKCRIEGISADVGTVTAGGYEEWRGVVEVADETLTFDAADNPDYVVGSYVIMYSTPGGITGILGASYVNKGLVNGLHDIQLYEGASLDDCPDTSECEFAISPVDDLDGVYNLAITVDGKTGYVMAKDASSGIVDEGNPWVLYVGDDVAKCGSNCQINLGLIDRDDEIYTMSVQGSDGSSQVFQALHAHNMIDKNAVVAHKDGTWKDCEDDCLFSLVDVPTWDLALKIDGDKDTFEYDSAYWTNDKTYSDATQEKTAFFNKEFIAIRLKMSREVDGVVTDHIIDFDVAGTSLANMFAGDYKPLKTSRVEWLKLAGDGFSPDDNCNTDGINAGNTDYFKARIGQIYNNEDNCDSPDGAVGIGLKSRDIPAELSAGAQTARAVQSGKFTAELYIRAKESETTGGCDSITSITIYAAQNSSSPCQDLDELNYYSKGQSTEYPELCSVSDPGGSCPSAMTFADAYSKCQKLGARLPTANELTMGMVRDGRCDMDSELVWSQSPCVAPDGSEGRIANAGNVYANGAPASTCVSEESKYYVRCVGDIDLNRPFATRPKKSCSSLGWPLLDDGKRCVKANVGGSFNGCSETVSFYAANAFCEAVGGRLPTAAEIEAAETAKAGCEGYDMVRLWSKDPCLTSTGQPGAYTLSDLSPKDFAKECTDLEVFDEAVAVCFGGR